MFPKILDYLIILVDSLSYDFRETFLGKGAAQEMHPLILVCKSLSCSDETCKVIITPFRKITAKCFLGVVR